MGGSLSLQVEEDEHPTGAVLSEADDQKRESELA